MRRTASEALAILVTATLGAFLLAVGVLLGWGSSSLGADVESQLRDQRIVFPQAGPATAHPEIGPFINKYAGQAVTTGEQARAYADHYLAVKLVESTGGRTYAELSAGVQVNPADAQLGELAEIAFRGETLRNTLLEAHSDAKLAQLTGYGAWTAFAGALAMLVLTGLGYRNLQQYHAKTAIPAARRASPAPVSL